MACRARCRTRSGRRRRIRAMYTCHDINFDFLQLEVPLMHARIHDSFCCLVIAARVVIQFAYDTSTYKSVSLNKTVMSICYI